MVVEHLHARDHGNAAPARFLAKALLVGNVEIAAMPGGESVEPFAESLLEKIERSLSDPESEEALLMLGDFEPGDPRGSLLAAPTPAGHEAAEVSIAFVRCSRGAREWLRRRR